jgi:hypothetical protein
MGKTYLTQNLIYHTKIKNRAYQTDTTAQKRLIE